MKRSASESQALFSAIWVPGVLSERQKNMTSKIYFLRVKINF